MKIFLNVIIVVSTFLTLRVQGQSEISVMTYNVENLFDDQDDSDRDDETYLPINLKQTRAHKEKCKHLSNFKFRKDCYQLDWNQSVIETKMKNLADVILSVDQGKGPDILILVEVENQRVLDQFNQRFLKSAAYKTSQLIEGDDPRGIDVAVLSRLELDGKSKLHSLELGKRTRGVLQVPLKLSSRTKLHAKLNVFAVHLPSQGSPTQIRVSALKKLSEILKAESGPWVVGGDFNVTDNEDKQEQLIETYLSPLGDVSHRLGCGRCQGTHNYKGKWSFLDILLFDHRLKKMGVSVDANSIKVVTLISGVGKKGKPKRFDPAKGQGASDHFPLYSRLFVQKEIK